FDRIFEGGATPIHFGGGALCALLLSAGWVLGLGPLLSESQQATTVQQRADAAETEASERQEELDRLQQSLAAIRQQLEDQPISLSSASRINPLLATIASWSEEYRLSITRTRAGRPKALTYYDYVPIELAGEGRYGDLLAFFGRLHRDRGDLGLVAFEVRRMSTSGEVAFDLDLAWYVVRVDEGLPGEGATAGVPTP
ncbi:MAG: type 4a pilus biogenesis protein PilO, partial [Phycisphaeraceae bacterium]